MTCDDQPSRRIVLCLLGSASFSGLKPLAEDLERLHRLYTAAPGMYRLAVDNGDAPAWIERNLDTIEVIERKMYNRHALWENLGLALTFPPRIQP